MKCKDKRFDPRDTLLFFFAPISAPNLQERFSIFFEGGQFYFEDIASNFFYVEIIFQCRDENQIYVFISWADFYSSPPFSKSSK